MHHFRRRKPRSRPRTHLSYDMNEPVHRFPSVSGGWTGTLRRQTKWLFIIGALLVLLGLLALTDAVAVTVFSMFLFGWILLAAGVLEAIQAVRHRQSGHLLVHVLNAVLALVVGYILVRDPVAGAAAFTFLLAAYFTVAGVFRIVAAVSQRGAGWAWLFSSGIVSLILGVLIWFRWPLAALWIIGLFIGIDLIVTGWSQIMLATLLRRLPD